MFIVDEIEILTALITTNTHVINREYFEIELEKFKIEIIKDLQMPCIKYVPTIKYITVTDKFKTPRKNITPRIKPRIPTGKIYPSDHPLFEERKDFIINQRITCGTTWALRWDYGTHYQLSSMFSWLGFPNAPERRLLVHSIIYPKGSQFALEAIELARGTFEFFGVTLNEERDISYIKQ